AKRYEMMPEQLQESFDGAETAEAISQVAAMNNLSSEQLDVVTCLTGDVLAGFTNYNDFPKRLVDEFGFNAILAQDIFKEIDRQIFLPVRDLLKQVYKLESEGVEYKKVEKQETADLLQKLGQPLKTTAEKISPFSPVQKPIVPAEIAEKEQEEKEFTVAPANVIDLSQKSLEPKAPDIISSKPISAVQEERGKTIFPFAKPTESFGVKSGMIMGQEQVVKPILGAMKPMEFSFGEIQPQKEKIVSDVEIQGGAQAMKENIEKRKPLETKPGFFGKLNNIIAPTKPIPQPVKVVNFSAPIPPPLSVSKEGIESANAGEIKAPFISVNSPLSRNTVGVIEPKIEQKVVTPIEPVMPMEPKVDVVKSEVIKIEAKEEVMPAVPPENVVNLKKLKF
ncbi:MAG TPA: hypothetical protein PKL20_01370, partial [Candidatus Paceibacterota bacterium]|nr:hypothetical protein [Candidatus Paceibacterota bacterium]